MARKYILYPICTIKDSQGEDWDVYEERKTKVGLTLNYGWLYGAPRQGSKSLILTIELIEYLKQLHIERQLINLVYQLHRLANLDLH